MDKSTQRCEKGHPADNEGRCRKDECPHRRRAWGKLSKLAKKKKTRE